MSSAAAMHRSSSSGLFGSLKPKPRPTSRAVLPSLIALLICISGLQQLWYLRLRGDPSQEVEDVAVQEPQLIAPPDLGLFPAGGADDIAAAGDSQLPFQADAVEANLGEVAQVASGGKPVYNDDTISDEDTGREGDEQVDHGVQGEQQASAGKASMLEDITAALFASSKASQRGSHSRHSKQGKGGSSQPRPGSPPFFVKNTGATRGIGPPTFDNWTLYQLEETPLLLNQAHFDEPGCRRGGDLNANGSPHSASLRYVMGPDGLMHSWDPLVDGDVSKNTEVKLMYPSSIIGKLPSNDTDFQFATCAIVSNSGTLLEGMFGAEIDSHDAIFRMNNAPTFGFEKYVGSKTTFDLLNRPHADEVSRMKLDLDANSSPEVAAVLFEADNWHLYYHILERQLKHMPYPATLVLAPTFLDRVNALWMRLARRWPRFANSCSGIKRAALLGNSSLRCQKMMRDCQNEVCKPSSGFFALAFASQMCNKIDMYGFESYRKAYPSAAKKKKTRYHYFDEEEGTTNVHSFVLLMKVFEFLSHRYPITIHTPHYNPEAERLLQIEERKVNLGLGQSSDLPRLLSSPHLVCQS